ncbi:MAG: hypothetical protein M3Q44_06145 [bacterium]|nr:hypothetical protein [bacterium]
MTENGYFVEVKKTADILNHDAWISFVIVTLVLCGVIIIVTLSPLFL